MKGGLIRSERVGKNRATNKRGNIYQSARSTGNCNEIHGCCNKYPKILSMEKSLHNSFFPTKTLVNVHTEMPFRYSMVTGKSLARKFQIKTR